MAHSHTTRPKRGMMSRHVDVRACCGENAAEIKPVLIYALCDAYH